MMVTVDRHIKVQSMMVTVRWARKGTKYDGNS